MATIFIPSQLQELTGGATQVEVEASTKRFDRIVVQFLVQRIYWQILVRVRVEKLCFKCDFVCYTVQVQ